MPKTKSQLELTRVVLNKIIKLIESLPLKERLRIMNTLNSWYAHTHRIDAEGVQANDD